MLDNYGIRTDLALEATERFTEENVEVRGVEIHEDYNEEKDIAFFVDRPTAYTKIYPGQFAIYFPEDGHAPGIGEGNIRKVIVKVQVEE